MTTQADRVDHELIRAAHAAATRRRGDNHTMAGPRPAPGDGWIVTAVNVYHYRSPARNWS